MTGAPSPQHDLARDLEDTVEALLPETETVVHVEPLPAVTADGVRCALSVSAAPRAG